MTTQLTHEFKLSVLREALRVKRSTGGLNSRNKEMAAIAIGFANVADEWRSKRRADFDAVDSPAVLKEVLLG